MPYGMGIVAAFLRQHNYCVEQEDLSARFNGQDIFLRLFLKNIDFAKRTGLDTIYLWGGEWWYWLKISQDNPDLWNEAKNLFKN